MKIHFLGAAGDVTGSAYQVVTEQASVLIDCGFFQGQKGESSKTVARTNSRAGGSMRSS